MQTCWMSRISQTECRACPSRCKSVRRLAAPGAAPTRQGTNQHLRAIESMVI